MRNRAIVALLLAGALLAACGDPNTTGAGSDGGGGGNVSESPDPDTPVTNTPGDDPTGPVKGGAQKVEPNPDAVDARPHIFEKAKVLDERTLRFSFYQCVAPCSSLQRVDVEYGTETIGVTLHVGHELTDEDVACIEIAVYNYVDVALDEPIDGRKIVDGAA
jgi:predicted small secreted protein